jgi:hypothetical protein
MRGDERHVLAAIDPASGSAAVRVVAAVVARQFATVVREVHVVAGPGERGTARQAAMAKVERGESSKIVGRPVDVLAALVESPHTLAAVLGTGNPAARASPRRPGGTAFSVARRVTRPLLVVPAGIEHWAGARRVLVPLDGTGITALAASAGLATVGLPETIATTVHVFDERTVPPFWDNPQHEYEAWTKEFKARYCDTIGEGLEMRAGPVGDQLTAMAASGAFDMVVVVWAQQTRGGRAGVVMDLLANTTVPILLVPTGFVTHALGGAPHAPAPGTEGG